MMILIFQKFLLKIFLISVFLFLILLKTSIAESFLFSLSTKGIKFGSFEMSAVENDNRYNISSNFESTGILGLFTKVKVESGVHGKIENKKNNNYNPIEVLSKWKSLFNQKQSSIKYKNKKIIHYEVLPFPRENKFALQISELDNTIDPLTVTYWLLKKRHVVNICKGEKLVSEGQTIIKVIFLEKKITINKINCKGEFQFIKGFDTNKYKKKNYKFNLYYKNNSNNKKIFSVTNLTFNTRLGLIEAIRL